jgi:rare lipoprotein A
VLTSLSVADLPQFGKATYYGKEFQHIKTACGERYCKDSFTAAHRTLPFGSRVKVTNLINDKWVIVRINDRGPFSKGRIIDLSYAAAKQIDMIRAGVASVRVEYATNEPEIVTENSSDEVQPDGSSNSDITVPTYAVQTGAFKKLENAQKALKTLKAKGFENSEIQTTTISGQTYHLVIYGKSTDKKEVENSLTRIKAANIEAYLVEL